MVNKAMPSFGRSPVTVSLPFYALGRPRITWLKTIQQEQQSKNLSPNEANDRSWNQPLWRLLYTSGATHS